jgi:polar amino acid transport system substrate-binding protein
VKIFISKAAISTSCLLALCICLGCAAQTAYQQPKESPLSQPVLRVGVCANAPPVIFKQSGSYAGIEAEFAREFASHLNMQVRFIDCAWDNLITDLLNGKIDIIMSGMTITKQRSVRIAFTDPYMQAGQMCLVRNEDKSRFPTTGTVQFTTMRVGAEEGTTGDFLVQRNLTLAKKEAFSSPEKGAKALIDGKIDLFVNDAPVIWWLAATYEAKGITTLPFYLTQEDIAWGVRKDDTLVLDSANRFIAVWKQNGRLKEMINRWLPNAL